ncbi:MAG: hypothetical protein AABZ47_12830 [Planctomycetota bacterium]
MFHGTAHWVLFLMLLSNGQNLAATDECAVLRYAWSVPSPGYSAGALAVDTEGNWYRGGEYVGEVDFDPSDGVDIRTSITNDQGDLFVSKLGPNSEYYWTYSVGSPLSESAGDIAIDPQGNVFVGGAFKGTLDFDPGPRVYELTIPPEYSFDGFIAKLTTDGTLLWARDFWNSYSMSSVDGLALDRMGNIIIVGGAGTISFAKLTGDGQDIWNKHISAPGANEALDVGIGLDDEIFFLGKFRFTVDFDPGPGVDIHEANVPPNFREPFLSKYYSDGSYAWTHDWPAGITGFSRFSVTLDGGAVFTSSPPPDATVDMDPTAGVDLRTGPALFVTKINRDGSYAWTYSASGDDSLGIATQLLSDGSILTMGIFSNFSGPLMDFDPSDGVAIPECPINRNCTFLLNLDRDGRFRWIKSTSNSQSPNSALAVSKFGEVYYANSYSYLGLADVDPTCGVDFREGPVGGSVITKLSCITNPGDSDSDSDVDLLDLAQFQNCFRGAGSRSCSPGCDAFDLNPDNSLDLADYTVMSTSVTGPG